MLALQNSCKPDFFCWFALANQPQKSAVCLILLLRRFFASKSKSRFCSYMLGFFFNPYFFLNDKNNEQVACNPTLMAPDWFVVSIKQEGQKNIILKGKFGREILNTNINFSLVCLFNKIMYITSKYTNLFGRAPLVLYHPYWNKRDKINCTT